MGRIAMLTIARCDPRHPDATRLLRDSHALMRALFTPDQNNFLSIDRLCEPHVTLFAAHRGNAYLGVAAMAKMDGYAELKSMYVDPAARGSGVADALIRRVEDAARKAGLTRLRLETGDTLHAAHAVYTRHGFTFIGPFGDYIQNDASLYMEKRLDV